MTATSTSTNGFPICILTPCSNSHPFDERRILVSRSEEDAVKIGRSVVKLHPASNNAIFDCKVLSRNHAILWMNAAGQFLIKDTRSSNGTFINNERLSASGEENEPRELFSGDILQLGVEIVDNAKKVASGCVTCIVRLLNERGEECAGRPKAEQDKLPTLLQQIPQNYTLVKNDQLFILDQYIKEATHKENLLGLKLQTLEEQLRIAHEALQTKWQEHVDQELLLSRIEQLESQLEKKKTMTSKKNGNDFSSKTCGSDGSAEQQQQQRLAAELRELAEDRGRIEQMAKESLRAMQEQVQETAMKLHDAEMSLINVEEECTFLRQRCIDFDAQMNRQRDDYDALLVKYNSVMEQLLHNRVEPTTTANNNTVEIQPELQTNANMNYNINSTPNTACECATSSTSSSIVNDNVVDTNGMATEPDHQHRIDGEETRNSANDDLAAVDQMLVMQEKMNETVTKLHDAEKNLVSIEMECTSLRNRCAKVETQLGRQQNDYDVLHGNYNMVCGFTMLAIAFYAYSSLESFFIICAFAIFVWSVHYQHNNNQQPKDDNNMRANVVDEVVTGVSQLQQKNTGEDEKEIGMINGHRQSNLEGVATNVMD